MNRQQFLPSTLIVLLTIAVAIYLVEKLGQAILAISSIVILLVLAWLLASLLKPLVNWIRARTLDADLLARIRQRWGDRVADRVMHPSLGLSIFLVYILLIAVLAVIVLAFVPLIIEQTKQLVLVFQQQADNLPAGIQRLTEFISSTREFLITRLQLDPAVIAPFQPQELVSQLTGFGTSVVQTGLNLLAGVASALGQFLLVVFLSAIMIVESGNLTGTLMHLIPKRYVSDTRILFEAIERAFGGFIRGTVLQGLIYAIVVTALMSLFNLGSAVAVGVATGMLMFLPIIGGAIGLLIPLTVGLLQSSPNTLWLIGLLAVFQFILFNVISPRLLSKALRIPTLLVIVSLLIGGQLFGIWGFFFAVPIAAVLYSIGVVLLARAKREQDQRDASGDQERALG
jgi:predicted PurR-regulated permease PerM